MAQRVAHVQLLIAVVDGGHWQRMSNMERGVWQVLYRFSDFESGRVALPMATIARLAGIRNVHRARTTCHMLEQGGLLRTVQQGGGQGERTIRQLLAPPPVAEPTLFSDLADAPETGTPHVPVSEANRDARGHLTGTSRSAYRDAQHPVTGTPQVPPFTSSLISTSSSPRRTGTTHVPVDISALPPRAAGGGKEEEEEIFKKLVERGVWDDSAREFAPQLTHALADKAWAQVVNDNRVKLADRNRVYFRRLQRLLAGRKP